MLVKLCIWMNIPSHYQSAFFNALDERDDVDLVVRYFQGVSQNRAAEGWCDEHVHQTYEQPVGDARNPEGLLGTVEDWEHRIHIINSHFSAELIEFFCKRGIPWCHWSETPGIRLAEHLGYRMSLYRMLNPLMLFLKRREGRMIQKHALGTFGQGVLARNAFQKMGVSRHKIADLFYTPEALPALGASERVVSFAKGRKVFLAVGVLCRRKGTDVLLKAFADLTTEDGCLVLCGLDKAGAEYQGMAEKLGIEDRVLFLGAYPADRIAEVYQASDVCILPSRFDGWGAVLNEAASLGLPLIGTDLCGASWHMIQDGLNGYRVRADSVAALKTAMQVYADEPALLESHGAASKELYFKEFTPEHNAARMINALQEWGE